MSTGLSLAQAHNAAATRTTASRSQLTRPVSNRAGEAANPSASHGRRGFTPERKSVESRAASAKNSAETITKARTSRIT